MKIHRSKRTKRHSEEETTLTLKQRITLMVLHVSDPLQTYFTSQMNFFVVCFEISFLEFRFS